jgi:hypothetical protein
LAFWNSLSLAHLRYAKIHRDQGGPLETISARESVRLGEPVFEAFVTLRRELMGGASERSSLYGNSDGSGTAAGRAEAVYRAISEALERWAWQESLREKRAELRFDLDGTTTGFAAFPGLFARSARANAYFEAVERWSLNAWWEEKLGQEAFSAEGLEGIEILSPLAGGKVVVVWAPAAGNGRAYGFAAGASRAAAVRKAKVELGRNLHVLEYYGASGRAPATLNEKRLVYFNSSAGVARFESRLARPSPPPFPPPPLVVDCAVPGPWGEYAKVWRCLFDPSDLCDNGEPDYFHF